MLVEKEKRWEQSIAGAGQRQEQGLRVKNQKQEAAGGGARSTQSEAKRLRWLALQVLVTNGHCECTKVTNIIFEHHPYQRGTHGISACLRPALN